MRKALTQLACQHFEPYLDPYFDTVVADQLTFLAAHVPHAQP